MANLPANRTKLQTAINNQQPTFIASSQANREALLEAYDTIDLLHQFLTAIQADPNGVYTEDTGITNAYAVTLAPIPTSYYKGMVIRFKAKNTNTGAATINANGLGNVGLKKNVTDNLAANDILKDQIITVVYDGTNFQLIGASQNELKLHKGEVVYHTITILRDLTIDGVQTVSGLPFRPKSIHAISVVEGTIKFSDGLWAESGSQRDVYQISSGVFGSDAGYAITMVESGNGTHGSIGNVTSSSFDINWSKFGSGATGTGIIILIIGGHY